MIFLESADPLERADHYKWPFCNLLQSLASGAFGFVGARAKEALLE